MFYLHCVHAPVPPPGIEETDISPEEIARYMATKKPATPVPARRRRSQPQQQQTQPIPTVVIEDVDSDTADADRESDTDSLTTGGRMK